MGISYSPDRADVLDGDYVSGRKTVTHSAQILVSAGASNLERRQLLYVENVGDKVCYFGPSGVTASGSNQGGKLYPDQWFWLSLGPNQSMYVICDTGETTDIIVHEWANP